MSVTNQAVAGRRRAPKAWPALFCLAVLAQATPPAAAETVDIRNVTNANGDVVFVVEIYGADAPFWYSGVNEYSPRNYTAAEKSAITLGAEYWAAVLKPNSAPFAPGIVRIGMDTATTFNAFTYYYGGPGGFGLMFQALQGPTDMRQPSNVAGDVSPDPHTLIEFHNIAWDTQASSSVPETATDMTAVFIHEMGHSLGITGGNPDWQDLVGSGGTAGAGYADRNPYPGVAGTLNFYGPTAMALYGGPVPLAHGSSQETSHFGIRNGLMTHGQISNYAMFTEVELAAIKDIGYDVDLRAFYGRSYYDDDRLVTKTVVSSAGFYDSKGLNPGGTWLGYNVGRPNLSPWGVGLHIFGSAYDITQTADLLADGRSGAGVRVDGFENTVRINPGVRVTAEGTQGTGLLVAFGSGHVINSQGSISATGSMGIGARFDFGAPYVAYRLMSYGRYPENDAIGTWLNIGGPLVEEFNLSGALLGGASNPDGQWLSGEFVDYDGRDIALYIGPGAHVANINVMNGASISGDIISRWDPAAHPSPVVNTDPESYMTNLTFGLAGNGSGGVTASPDINFFLNYRGNITGPESLNVSLHGGTLEYAGAMNVYSFATGANTTLLAGFVDGGGPTTITATTSIVTDPTSHIGFGQTSLVYGAPQ
ncbi:MAG: hypothetical protein LBR29_11540, partial [Methylobacteriaceae bacterium]|nr:hypothetical protein [Methylobacteriaceae bacterium]